VENTQEFIDGKKRLTQAYETYHKLAEGKIGDFNQVKEYLTNVLEQLLEEGKISSKVMLVSRVKSPESVVQNWRIGKELYDIFGVTLLTTTQQEMDEIRKKIRNDNKFNISSKKKMNEKRGYDAIHFLLDVGKKEKKTQVECHMQTHESYKNVYPHIFYKVRRKIDRDLTKEEEKEIEQKVQQMYEEGTLSGFQLSKGRKSRIPQMWVTSFNKEGKMEEQELDEEIILTIMYPFLDVSKENKEQASLQETSEKEEVEI
jgi:ppGpp synthetase/RelA/SpoT-type nucleotidyltranferase